MFIRIPMPPTAESFAADSSSCGVTGSCNGLVATWPGHPPIESGSPATPMGFIPSQFCSRPRVFGMSPSRDPTCHQALSRRGIMPAGPASMGGPREISAPASGVWPRVRAVPPFRPIPHRGNRPAGGLYCPGFFVLSQGFIHPTLGCADALHAGRPAAVSTSGAYPLMGFAPAFRSALRKSPAHYVRGPALQRLNGRATSPSAGVPDGSRSPV